MAINKFGFDSAEIDEGEFKRIFEQYETVLNHRNNRWSSELKMKDDKVLDKSDVVKRFVRKGIPSKYRCRMWMHFSGAKAMLEANRGKYESLLNEGTSEYNQVCIEKDLPRTFPANVNFDPDGENTLLPYLKRILSAVSANNPSIGYCQGMGYVVAALLLVFDPRSEQSSSKITPGEEEVFWLFQTMLNSYLAKYYASGMEGLQIDCKVVDALISKHHPKLGRHLSSISAESVLSATKCFLCVFVDMLPIHTVLRIFDALFYEGDKILFRAVLTLFLENVNALLAAKDVSEYMVAMQAIKAQSPLYNPHEFLNRMFKLPKSLSKAEISALRKRFESTIKHQ